METTTTKLMADGYQNENIACRSMRRLAEADENGPPAIEMDWPKNGELKLPTGWPGLRLFSRLRAMMLKVRL
jgi:hypothetical protein